MLFECPNQIREAYETAKKSFYPLIEQGIVRKDGNSRTNIIYAHFACKMGEHEHARAVVGEPRDFREDCNGLNFGK